MKHNSTLRRLGPGALLAFGLIAFGPVQAIDFGDMMNPGRWFTGADRDRDFRDPHFAPGFGPPFYGPDPYGRQQWGQPFPGQQQQPPESPFPGQQQWPQPPSAQVPAQPSMPMERPHQWSTPGFGEQPFTTPGWEYGQPGFGAPGAQWGVPSPHEERLQQRVRELEQRIEELERRRPEPRRTPPPSFERPEFPPLEREPTQRPRDRDQYRYPPFER